MTAFAALHRPGRPFLLPNAWDAASAALLAEEFPAVGTTSLGVAAAAGVPDAAGAAREPTLALAAAMGRLPVPVTVDVEGGFGAGPAAVAAFAVRLAAYGVAGVNIEDGRGDRLAPAGELAAIVTAVKDAVPGLFVNARTDTHWLRTGDAREAVRRLRIYADAGADGVFVPGMGAERDIAAVVEAVPRPVNVLYGAGGHSPERLGSLGVARISTGSLLYRAALGAAAATALAAAAGKAVAAGAPSYERVSGLAPGADHAGPPQA